MRIDKVYKEMLHEILETGVETPCRAKWDKLTNVQLIQ